MNQQRIYTDMLRPRAPGYNDQQVIRNSHYRDAIDHSSGRLAGNSHRGGDASPEVQSRCIDLLIQEGRDAGLAPREIAIVLAIAGHESGFNPDAAAGTTTAFGLGQFINRTGAAYGLNDDNRADAREQARALVAHFQDNQRLAASHGQGDEYIYKYHHDGPKSDLGGLGLSRAHVMPFVDRYEAFVRAWERDHGVGPVVPRTARAQTTSSLQNPLADGILRKGEDGAAVTHLQERLRAHGMHGADGKSISVTGHFRDNTEAAVREFQLTHGLAVTGQADAATRGALERPPVQHAPVPASPGVSHRATPTASTTGEVGFDAAMRRVLPPESGVAPHITSPFHAERGAVDHQGVDFNYVGGQNGVNLRHPTVGAPASGTVIFAGGQYGTVKIKDAQGNVHEILHTQTQTVHPGDVVKAGDPIGTMGGRGPNGATQFAQHVHYQLRDPHGNIIDPVAFWNDPRHRDLGAASRNPHSAPAHDAMSDGRLAFGEAGPAVVRLQERLNAWGIRDADGHPLPPTGNFREKTQAAVREFQHVHALPETGVADAVTLGALAKNPEIRRGDQGSSVLHLQQMLEHAGLPVPKTGSFTYLTEGAVKEFQATHRLEPTGVVDGETLYRLRRAEQAHVLEPKPAPLAVPPGSAQPDVPTPSSRADASHVLVDQARPFVQALNKSAGRPSDAQSENLISSLAAKAQADGLDRIDHVVLSTDRTRLIAVQGEGESRRVASVDINQAMATPARDSLAQLDAAPARAPTPSMTEEAHSRGARVA